jgi:hypothetical protein
MLTGKVCTLALVLKVLCVDVVVTLLLDLAAYIGRNWVLVGSLLV